LIKIRFNKNKFNNNYTVKMNSENCDNIESELVIVHGTPEKVIDSKIQEKNEIIVPETPENALPESKEKEDVSKIIEETPEPTNNREQEKRKTFELFNKYVQGNVLTPDEQHKVYKIFKGKSCISGRKFCKGRHPTVPQQKAPTNFSFEQLKEQPAVSRQNPFDLRQPRRQPAVSKQNPFDFPLGGEPAVGPFSSRPSDVWRQLAEKKQIDHSDVVTEAVRFCTGFLMFFSEQKFNQSEYAQQKAIFNKMLAFCIRQKRHRDIIQEARKYCIDYLEDFYPDTSTTKSERAKEKQASDLFLDMMDLCEKHVI
jgi:hypothetical protein